MSASTGRDLFLLRTAAFLRSFCIGLVGVLLGVFLFRNGFSTFAIGVVLTAGLAGSSLATLFVGLRGDRFGRKRTLILLAVLTALGWLVLALNPAPFALTVLAVICMLNGTGTDRSAGYALEQAVIPGLVADQRRTWALSWYNALIDAGGALGGLAAGLPFLLEKWFGQNRTEPYRQLFFGCAALGLLAIGLYCFLSNGVESGRESSAGSRAFQPSPEARRIVFRLASLISLDAFGGGFLLDALVAYWFFRRFGLDEGNLGLLFFAIRVLNALSHLGAAWLARRIGLLNTMVLTHLPSSLFLIAIPFAPSLRVAIVLFLCREALVEMDVPTRQSYVAAVVRPEERVFASGITNLTRNVSWALGSLVAGGVMQVVAFSAPLLFGGGAKILYDVLLFRAFRGIKPPEERPAAPHP
jgi:MFS family permease